jgi:hypothetical protein
MTSVLAEAPTAAEQCSINCKVLHAPVTVEYDSRGKRVQKTLPDSYAARSFYARMFRQGRQPRVVYKQAAS